MLCLYSQFFRQDRSISLLQKVFHFHCHKDGCDNGFHNMQIVTMEIPLETSCNELAVGYGVNRVKIKFQFCLPIFIDKLNKIVCGTHLKTSISSSL